MPRSVIDEITEALERATPDVDINDAQWSEVVALAYLGRLLHKHSPNLLAVVRAAAQAEKVLPKDDESRYRFSEAVRLAMDLRRTLRNLDPRLLGEL